MGVTYSVDSDHRTESEPQLEDLRLSYEDADKLIKAYHLHQFQPVMEAEEGLPVLFYAAYGRRLETEMAAAMTASRQVFSDKTDIIYTQEVLVAIALLSRCPWTQRAKLLFNAFKCMGTEELGHEDIILGATVVAASLCRLWGVDRWEGESLATLSESIADNAFTKLEKELDDGVNQDKFVLWAVDRFRGSRTVATSEALLAIYSSAV